MTVLKSPLILEKKLGSPSEFSGAGLESEQDASDDDFEDIPEKTKAKLQVPLNSIQNNIPEIVDYVVSDIAMASV